MEPSPYSYEQSLCHCRCHTEGFWAFDCCYPYCCGPCATCGQPVRDPAAHVVFCKPATNDFVLRLDRFRLEHAPESLANANRRRV